MDTSTIGIQEIKQAMKAVWSAGEYGKIAKLIMPEGEDFVKRLKIRQGSKVLDVACGNGNLSLPAAKTGADVTGIDIVPGLIREAKERAISEKLKIKFDVGDAEDMPYEDSEFDYVISMFGAMFAPRPEVTAGELVRVCKPSGIIAMANWTPEGFVGDFFRLTASYLPPNEEIPAPVLWGKEAIVKARLDERISDFKTRRLLLKLILPMPPAEVAEHYIEYFGPTNTTYYSLDEASKILFKNDFIKLWADHNIGKNNETIVDAEYLEVVAKKG